MSHTAGDKIRAEMGALENDAGPGSQSIHIGEESCAGECNKGMHCGGTRAQGSESLCVMLRMITYF